MRAASILILLTALSSEVVSGEYREDEIGYSYPDSDTKEFLVQVLVALEKDYRMKVISGAETISWVPDSPEQEREVSGRVSQYIFVKEVCPKLPVPSPSDPVNWNLSCKK